MYKSLLCDRSSISRTAATEQNLSNMKSMIIVALAFVAVAVALPVDKNEVQVLKQYYNQDPQGSFQQGYETNDGVKQESVGELKEVRDEENKPQTVVGIRGSFSYTSPEGIPVNVVYYADDTGFHAEGDVVPKAARR